VLACWLSGSSATLVETVAGPRFAPAVAVVAIMSFYPVSQTLGQISTAALKATEQTATYARASIALSIPDLALTWFLLAPHSATVPGLNLGALGVAVKTALYGLVSVHVLDWINCRLMGISFGGVLVRRLNGMLLVGSVALVTLRFGGSWLENAGAGGVPTLLLTSCVYGVAVAALVWWLPQLAGLTREQILRVLRREQIR
jgi:hypothetical protein